MKNIEEKILRVDGWLFVPFYSLLTFVNTHILLEWFTRQNPPRPDPDNGDTEDEQCERQADEVLQPIQRSIDVLINAQRQWPTMDLGPVGSVLGIPTPRPPVEYNIVLVMRRPPVIPTLNIQVTFHTSKQIATFEGEAIATPGLPIEYEWKGTAKLNYDVEWLVGQSWQADFEFTYGPDGMNVSLRSLSGEELGHISSSDKRVVLPGAAKGRGSFRP